MRRGNAEPSPKIRPALPGRFAEGVETRRGAPNAMRTSLLVYERNGEGIVQRTNDDARIVGIERCSVTKIRRLTACRFESGPGHQRDVPARAEVFRETPLDQGLAGFFLPLRTDLVLRQPMVYGVAALLRQEIPPYRLPTLKLGTRVITRMAPATACRTVTACICNSTNPARNTGE